MWSLYKIRSVMHLTKRRLRRIRTLDEIRKDSSFLYPPPDGGWGWVVVLAAAVHCLLVSGFHNAFGVYMLPLLETFESSNSRIAWIGSVSYAFIMIFGPISGKLLVKHGAIKVAIIGALVVIFGLVCSSYTYDLRVLFLTHGIIVGVGSSLASTPGLIMVSLYFTKKRSFATGIVMAGGAAGTFVQNKLHHYLIQTLGWRASLRVYSGILTICIFAGFAYKPLQKHRTHPSVVEKFKTSPLRGFIVDLSLWKDRIFEVWVCSLGLAKFGFFIPFVHMFKLAGDLGISLDDASYIMVGIGVSSMFSCLLFGKICDIERIDRLYLNQASILSVGVVYFIIPHCKTFASLVAICSLLGFFDAGNYVLLPVLTFDLMGAEKMPVAWGFMMAVNAISCFGPPFAGAMYDIYGSYTIGFVVTGVCNIAAANILAFIPWLKKEAVQSKKNYLNASVCEITNTIVPWQSPSPSLGSLSSSDTKSISHEGSTSEYSKRFSMKSFKSILKSDATSFKSAVSDRGAWTPQKRAELMASLAAGMSDSDPQEQGGSLVDLKPVQERAVSETASFQSETVSINQAERLPHRKEDGVAFLEDYDGDEEEQIGSITGLKSVQGLNVSNEVFLENETSECIKQAEHLPHRKEDGVAFVDEYDSGEEKQMDSTITLKSAEELNISDGNETSVSMNQAERLPHRKEDGVAFVDEYDSGEEKQMDSTTTLRSVEELNISDETSLKNETSKSIKQAESLPHRKEDGVAFVDEYDSGEEKQMDSTTTLRSAEELNISDGNETSVSMNQAERLPHRKEDGVAFVDEYDSGEEKQMDSTTTLRSVEELNISDETSLKNETSKSIKQAESLPHRKEDGVAFVDDYDGSKEEQLENETDLRPVQASFKGETSGHARQREQTHSTLHRKEDGVSFFEDTGDYGSHQQKPLQSTAVLRSTEDVAKSGTATTESETSASVKEAGHISHRKEGSVAFAADAVGNEQLHQQK